MNQTQQATQTDTPIEMIVMVRDTMGRKFAADDIANGGGFGTDLYNAAAAWLPSQVDVDFPWLHDLARAYVRGGGLSDRQAAGVLNCMVAAERRKVAAAAPPTTQVIRVDLDADDTSYDAWLMHVASSVSKGFYTIVTESGRRTFKVGDWRDDNRRPGEIVRWIGFLMGSDNTSDYLTCARQSGDGTVTLTRAFATRDDLRSELATLFGEDVEGRAAAREAYAMESGACARCGRLLTVPASLLRGLGPDCAGKVLF